MEEFEINTTATLKIAVCLYSAATPINETLIIASATGVKQRYYTSFASYLAACGYDVFTLDYRGIGKSRLQSLKNEKTTVLEWANRDLESLILYAEQRFPNNEINLLGHSLGGQILGLVPSSVKAATIILVASQSGYWKFWQGKLRYKVWMVWHVLIPVALRLFGYLPSKKIMRMENLPKQVVVQWCGWCKNKNYLFDRVDSKVLYYKKTHSKLYSFSIEGDRFAPKEAVDWLTKQYENTEVQRIHLISEDFQMKNIGHFGVFQKISEKTIWPLLVQALRGEVITENK